MEHIAKAIRDTRHEKGLTLEKLAHLAGITYGTMCSIEKGKSVIITKLLPVCRVLGLELIATPKKD